MKYFKNGTLLILYSILIFILLFCGCSSKSSEVKYYYKTPKTLVPYDTIIEKYHPSVGSGISEIEVQQLFTILKNLYDQGNFEYEANTIYITDPNVRIRLDVISMKRGSEFFY
ncbi:MAG: hypothetical protein JW967_00465 [Dehalococcoidales bacterium]|nr:hypothetical protein [Dehalococcoidales bacterium]